MGDSSGGVRRRQQRCNVSDWRLSMRRRANVMLFLALAAAGCPRNPFPIGNYDDAQARQTLIAALEAWKQKQVAALATREPPIRFVDEDYSGGSVLLEYELLAADQPIRPYDNVPVRVTLREPQGTVITTDVAYQITLEPKLAVLRGEL
jgi:hypothetical protein